MQINIKWMFSFLLKFSIDLPKSVFVLWVLKTKCDGCGIQWPKIGWLYEMTAFKGVVLMFAYYRVMVLAFTWPMIEHR